MKGNTVGIKGNTPAHSSLYLVSEYSTGYWASDADHWIHTARHEAGHAVARICMYRKFGRHEDAFERVLIRPGATESYITKRGRQSDCLGTVEHDGSGLLPRPRVPGCDAAGIETRRNALRSCDPDVKREMAAHLEIRIVSRLAGPLAEMCSWNETADLLSAEYDRAWEDNEEEIACARDDVSDLQDLAWRGTMRDFEWQSFDLIKAQWPAIVALADELMDQHVLEYDDAVAIIEPWLAPDFAPPRRGSSSKNDSARVR
jgi:hypothetical protein